MEVGSETPGPCLPAYAWRRAMASMSQRILPTALIMLVFLTGVSRRGVVYLGRHQISVLQETADGPDHPEYVQAAFSEAPVGRHAYYPLRNPLGALCRGKGR